MPLEWHDRVRSCSDDDCATVAPFAIPPQPAAPLPSPQLVSLLVVVADGPVGVYLPALLRSVMRQSHAHWELIACVVAARNTSATHGVGAYLHYLAQVDERVMLLRYGGGSVWAGTRVAMAAAHGSLLLWVGPEDELLPNHAAAVAAAAASFPEVSSFVARYEHVDSEGTVSEGPAARPHTPQAYVSEHAGVRPRTSDGRSYSAPPAFAVRRDAAALLDERFPMMPSHAVEPRSRSGCAVWAFLATLAEAAPPVVTLPVVTYRRRVRLVRHARLGCDHSREEWTRGTRQRHQVHGGTALRSQVVVVPSTPGHGTVESHGGWASPLEDDGGSAGSDDGAPTPPLLPWVMFPAVSVCSHSRRCRAHAFTAVATTPGVVGAAGWCRYFASAIGADPTFLPARWDYELCKGIGHGRPAEAPIAASLLLVSQAWAAAAATAASASDAASAAEKAASLRSVARQMQQAQAQGAARVVDVQAGEVVGWAGPGAQFSSTGYAPGSRADAAAADPHVDTELWDKTAWLSAPYTRQRVGRGVVRGGRVLRLAVVPSEGLTAIEDRGSATTLLARYNPRGMFDEVYWLSAFEVRRLCCSVCSRS